jgi:acetolactate synthase-1/2/3 large subunit
MKVSDIISNFLINRNINTVFGIIGSANSHIYDSFNNYNIKIINVHNEQSAVIAAGAYFKTTGKIAIALVTAGGGATNAVTGIVSLWADSTPTIIFSGQEQSYYVNDHNNRRMYGTQGFDIAHMVSKTTKYSKTILNSSIIQDELEKIYSIMLDGRKGPVLLDIPFDIQTHNIDYRKWNDYIPIIVNNGISNIQELLSLSQRPVILAGNGVKLSNSTEIFKTLLENIQVPVLLTWSGIDILDNEHPLYFGRPGIYGQRSANFILQKSDLLIVLGSRLTLPQTGYDFKEFARTATIVMVDIDTTEFKSFAHVCINTDCNQFINQLYNIKLKYCNQSWLDECIQLSKSFPLIEPSHKDDEFPNSYKIIDKISDYLKPTQIIVTDMGTALLSGHQVIRLKQGHTMFSSYGLGEMGYGLPAALGAAISSETREVLCLNCDGGMMLNLQELQTIIQHKLKIKIVIFNNDGYLMIKHTQKLLFNGTYNSVNSNTGIVLPDYMKVAHAFGYEKFQIKSWEDFYNYFPKFMDFDGPSICEIFMPPDQEFIPKVKGVVNINNNTIFSPPIEEMSPLLNYDIISNIMTNNISIKSNIIVRN